MEREMVITGHLARLFVCSAAFMRHFPLSTCSSCGALCSATFTEVLTCFWGGGDQHALGRVSTCLGGGGGVGINMPWEGDINMSWGGGGERGLTCLGKGVHALGEGGGIT